MASPGRPIAASAPPPPTTTPYRSGLSPPASPSAPTRPTPVTSPPSPGPPPAPASPPAASTAPSKYGNPSSAQSKCLTHREGRNGTDDPSSPRYSWLIL